MRLRSSPLVPVVALAAALLALPACGMKEATTPSKDTVPPGMMPPGGGMMPPGGGAVPPGAPNYPNGKMQFPPGGGVTPPSGGGTTPPTGGGNTPADPSLPAPPALKTPLFDGMNGLAKLTSTNNLKQIALAFINAADTYGGKFTVGIVDKSGKVGLSWRVALLPYLDQVNLYKEFKLDEPWDSDHNKKLIAKMPAVFSAPRVATNGYTYYRGFTGPDAVLAVPDKLGMAGQPVLGIAFPAGIPDGTSNTLLVAEATDPVIWTKPDDLVFDKTKAPPKLGESMFAGGFHAARCDGSVKFISGITPANLSKAINRRDGDGQAVDFGK